MTSISRLLRPRSVVVVGGGAWARSVREQCLKFGFEGRLDWIHPTADGAVRSVEELASPPDAAFIAVNRRATVDAVGALSGIGAGGAVCFSSGWAEAEAETGDGAELQARLVAAAGGMPILGPNCYGLLNAFDGVALWPDQHGLRGVARGVALVTQSSNIAINLTMQSRGLPIGAVVCVGNQAQLGQAEIASALLDDSRISAIGLHIEGISDPRSWEEFAARARSRGIPVVALKVGASEQARAAAVSHTASLAGVDAGASAFLERVGIARVGSPEQLLEALKIHHVAGKPKGNRVAAICCSGGEAGLSADLGEAAGLDFPALSEARSRRLRGVLGPEVALANPLDYHTHIWRDGAAMAETFAAMAGEDIDVTVLVLDYPRPDRCDASDWDIATEAALAASARSAGLFAVCASLPELMPEDVAERFIEAGVVPFMGIETAFRAIAAAVERTASDEPVLLPDGGAGAAGTLTEAEAKEELSAAGVPTPNRAVFENAAEIDLAGLTPPVAVKGLGAAHKTEAGAVALSLESVGAAREAAGRMDGSGGFLVEEMVEGAVAELLVGVVADVHGYLLTLAAGGVLSELLDDRVHLLVPASDREVDMALDRLRIGPALRGYRGRPGADRAALISAVRSFQDFVISRGGTLVEAEINPLIVTPRAAVAADALIRRR